MRNVAPLATMIVLMVYGLMAPYSQALASGHLQAFDAFWREALVDLSGWPADVRSDAGTVSFTALDGQRWTCDFCVNPQAEFALPLLYVVDGAAPTMAEPAGDHSWMRLVVPPLATGLPPAADARQAELYPVILAACRALTVLDSLTAAPSGRVGVVGEWRGGAVAVALGALMADHVAFVCAYDPRFVIPAGRPATRRAVRAVPTAPGHDLAVTYYDVARFAAGLRAPLLVGAPGAGRNQDGDGPLFTSEQAYATDWAALPGSLASAAGRRCWTDMWQTWAVALTTAQGAEDVSVTSS